MIEYGIKTRSLYFSYPQGKPLFEDLNINIPHGQCVGLIGANGAGKSTLLNLFAGLLPSFTGEATVAGIVVKKNNLPLLRKKCGLIFQDPDDQLFSASVYEDVSFGPRNFGLSSTEVEARTNLILDRIGIAHLSDRPPFLLSGGEKRAAAIASVLSMEPDVLLLDEPSAALDPKARRRIMKFIASLSQTRLIATHDLDLVLDLCDHVIILSQGSVVAEGEASVLLLDEELMDKCGLELPLSAQMCKTCQRRIPHV